MKTSNKKAHAFKRGAALITAAFIVLTAALVFTACSNNADGSGGGGGSIEGVWKPIFSKTNDEAPVPFPETATDNSTKQPYVCFSEGKVYSANEIAGKANDAENGFFQDEQWEKPYVFASGILTIAEHFSVPFIITGSTATMTMTDAGDTMVIQLTRVSAPTVTEIKAAK